ncbi:MAG TPA: hypothetical protein VMJ10_10260 [Kofleriaceae bacterium]|nr:hypothetical protein [Kofleriaceae bacterium]
MAIGKRPGGLTALAVLNFVFGGIGALAALLGFGGLALVRETIQKAQENGVKYEGQSLTMAYVAVALTGACALLLIVSGIGYIKQSRFAGRTLGNLYGLLSIGGTVLSAATGGGIGVFSILFLVYPLLTLILLNSAFKANLVD